jgi:hypothetical protein
VREHDDAIDPAEPGRPELGMLPAKELSESYRTLVRLPADVAERPTILKPSPLVAGNRATVPLGFDHDDATRPEDYVIDISPLARNYDIVDDDVVIRELPE